MKDTTTNLIDDSARFIFNWLSANFNSFIGAVAILISTIIVIKIISIILNRLLSRTIREERYPSKTDRDRRLRTLTSIITTVVTFLIWAVAVFMILNLIGINTAPLLASAGLLSVALGFGAKSIVQDFMTGMFIIAENQYRVGDYVEIQNIQGTVRSVTMRTTTITDDDGSVFHIPNGSIVVTGNHSMSNNKVAIEISVATDTNVDKLKSIIDRTGTAQATNNDWKDKIAQPLHFARIKDITDGSIIIRISGKVKAGKQIDIRSDYLAALQKELVKNKISLV